MKIAKIGQQKFENGLVKTISTILCILHTMSKFHVGFTLLQLNLKAYPNSHWTGGTMTRNSHIKWFCWNRLDALYLMKEIKNLG